MCDEANNCRTVEITVNLSPIYYIKYTGGSSGSVANTTCYYEHNCTLANNGFGKTGYYFTKWKIGSTNYNAGATVKNLSSSDGTTLTATAQWAGNTYTIKARVKHGTSCGHRICRRARRRADDNTVSSMLSHKLTA